MWIVASYLPVSFFSLKPASATSSGGKTLLIPTPYAIKMALLNNVIRSQGLAEGERLFPFLRDLDLLLEPPETILVMKSFSKIRREHVEQAFRDVEREGIGARGGSYFVKMGGKELPAKRVLRAAYLLANGAEISVSAFSGGVFTAKILEGLGVEVVVRSSDT